MLAEALYRCVLSETTLGFDPEVAVYNGNNTTFPSDTQVDGEPWMSYKPSDQPGQLPGYVYLHSDGVPIEITTTNPYICRETLVWLTRLGLSKALAYAAARGKKAVVTPHVTLTDFARTRGGKYTQEGVCSPENHAFMDGEAAYPSLPPNERGCGFHWHVNFGRKCSDIQPNDPTIIRAMTLHVPMVDIPLLWFVETKKSQKRRLAGCGLPGTYRLREGKEAMVLESRSPSADVMRSPAFVSAVAGLIRIWRSVAYVDAIMFREFKTGILEMLPDTLARDIVMEGRQDGAFQFIKDFRELWSFPSSESSIVNPMSRSQTVMGRTQYEICRMYADDDLRIGTTASEWALTSFGAYTEHREADGFRTHSARHMLEQL